MIRKTPLAGAISCILAAGALGVSTDVLAQVESDEATGTIEEVIVTGSRIRKDVYTSSAPLDIITPTTALNQGIGDVGDMLQTSTAAAGSFQITPAWSTAFNVNGGTGAKTLSLRGLGAARTLVLLNGRRAGPAGVRGGVSSFDLNVLPLSTIERVEILKDGASSIYGSDAVAGVVNIITKKEDGGTVDVYASQPTEDGGEESRINFSWGKSFDRGNFRITGDYRQQSELARGDREYFRCTESYMFYDDTGERADPIDPRTGKYRCGDESNGSIWGHVWVYDYQDGGNVPVGTKMQYDYDGDLGDYIPPLASDPNDPGFMTTPPGWYPVAYDRLTDGITNYHHPLQDTQSVEPKDERITVYAEGEFELTDSTTAYAEVLLNRRETYVNGFRQYWSYIYNADAPDFWDYDEGGNPLSEGWHGDQWLSPTPITDWADNSVTIEYRRYVAGVRGDLDSGWNWDVSFQYSKSDGDYWNQQIYDDSVWTQNWLWGSCEGELTYERGVPCIDIPWLDPAFLNGEVSPEIREFLFGEDLGNTEYTQWSVEGYMSGDIFDMPAGTVAAAIGFHYRQDELLDVPGEMTRAGNVWGNTSAGITQGDDTTQAIFAEINMPLLRDKPGVQDLTLNASARYTDVDSYGSDTTYKVGVNWQITPSVKLRANHGTSFRTPALFELYINDQTGFVSQKKLDPCIEWGEALAAGDLSQRVADNCAADGLAPDYLGGAITGTVITGGGVGVLAAETSDATTIGIVWQPGFANLSLSLDYFDIEVKNQVDQVGPQEIVFGCYNSDFFPSDPLCNLFDRSGLNRGIENVRDSYINIATQRNRGLDFSALYTADLPWGHLSVETQHTYQLEDEYALFAETAEDLNGEVGEPEWVGRLNVSLDRGPWNFYWGARFVGPSSSVESFGGNTITYRGDTIRVVMETDTVMYHAFSVSREFEDQGFTARLGVANAFDEEPPRITTEDLGEVYTLGNSAFYSQYDWLGRRFFLNLTKKF